MSEIKENNEFPLFVTYIDCDGPLLQIHGHLDKKSVVQMEEMLTSIVNHLDNLKPEKISNLLPNMLCCVKFHEQRYYRARLLSPLNDGFVIVQLLDYGNIEKASIENIRFLTDIQESRILQQPIILKTFVLSNVIPFKHNWTQDKLQCIKSILTGRDVVIKYLGQFECRHLIQLKYQDRDFARVLFEKNIANYVNIDIMLRYIYK